jgi:hypothetical protein
MCLGGAQLWAQRPIEIIAQLSEPFPTEVGDFVEQFDNYSITVINHSDQTQELYFLADYFGDNGISVTMDRFYQPAQPLVIPPNDMVILSSDDIESLNADLTEDQVFYEGITQQQLLFGSIPEGNYTLCFNAFDFNTGELLSVGCSMPIYVSNANVPNIIMPFEGDSIPVSELPVFNIVWEFPGNMGQYAMDLQYEMKIVNITDNYDWDIEELFSDAGIPVHLEEVIDGQTQYVYNGLGDDPPLQEGHEYGVRIRATDPMQQHSFANGGYSQIRRFWYGSPGATYEGGEEEDETASTDTLPTDCESRCEIIAVTNTTAITDLNTIDEIKLGHFTLENYNLTLAGDAFSGEAEVNLDIIGEVELPVRVQISNLKINSEGVAFEGSARGVLAEGEDLQGLADHLQFPDEVGLAVGNISESDQIDISNLLEGVRTWDALSGGTAVGLPVGIPYALQGNLFYLGLTDLSLTPKGAKAKVMMSAKLAVFEGEERFLLVGDSVCIHPEGFGGQYSFGLHENLQITGQTVNHFELFLNGANSGNDAFCNVEMSCDGIEALNIHGHAIFPRNVLTPYEEGMVNLPPPEEKVKAHFSFSLQRGSGDGEDSTVLSNNINWIASVEVDPFTITGLKGWKFETTSAYLDMSDLANPEDAYFPEEYHTTTADFRGFYLKEAKLTPPPHLLLDSTYVLVNDLLIDPALYGKIELANVLPIEKGNLAGFGFGIDSLKLEFYDNALLSGRMTGPIQLPITDQTDSLQYTALIESTNPAGDDPEYGYVFDLMLQDNVKFPFMIAEAEIYDDSYMDIAFIPSADQEVFVQTYLHGELNINTEQFYPENLPDLPAEAKLVGIEYEFDYTSGVGFNSDNTSIGFASPQKLLGGFPINMDNFNVGLDASYETVAVQFDVGVSFGAAELDLAAGASFDLISNLEPIDAIGDVIDEGVDGATAIAKTFRLQGVQFDSIFIELDKGSFAFDGMISFFNEPLEDEGRNKGVRGALSVVLPVGGIQGQIEAVFGNIGTPPDVEDGTPITYNEDYYSYWYVRGLIAMGTGIPICSGVGIYGLGAGVGYNMIQTDSATIVDGQVVGEAVFEPTYNSFRIELTVILGTHPKPDAFNADVTIGAQFVNGGLDMLFIKGDGYLMTPMADRGDPQVYVGVGVHFYTQNEERDWFIDGYLRVAVNVAEGKFRGNMTNPVVDNQMVDAQFYVSEEQWYFYAGQPDFDPNDDHDPRGSAEFAISEELKAEFKAYMMVGHGIPTSLPPLPPDIQRILSNPSGELGGTQTADNVQATAGGPDVELGVGFAHGSSGSLTASIDADIVYADFWVCLGYDMNITQPEYPEFCANTGRIKGINGWYAEGQAYAGIEGGLGVKVKLFGSDPTKFHLMDLAAAIALYGGAPAPAYFGGTASVYYSLLGGKIDGDATFEFSVGEKCAAAPNDPLAGIKFIEYVDPGDGDRDIPPFKRALCKFSLPIDETIIVPVPVMDANNNVIRTDELAYTPRVEYSLKRDFRNDKSSVELQGNPWIDDRVHDALALRPREFLKQNRWYKLKITVKAIDEQSRDWLEVDGKTWKQDTVIRFRTGPYPEDLYQLVQYCIPMAYSRYYLQDENTSGKMFFTMALPEDHYFPQSGPNGLGSYSYFVRFTNLHDQSQQEFPLNTSSCCNAYLSPELSFPVPELENERIYALQIIRKGSWNNLASASGRGETNTIQLYSGEEGEQNLNTRVIPPGEMLESNEFLLYHTYFRTSKYDDMAAKIADAQVSSTEYLGNHSLYGSKLKVHFEMEEKFEQRDFQSFYPAIEGAEDLEFSPRVKMTDIFSTAYHNGAESKFNGLLDYFDDNMSGYWYFPDYPQDLRINWTTNTYDILPSNNLSGPLDPPLTEDEISELWSNYLEYGELSYASPSMEGSFEGGSISVELPPNYTVRYKTHFRIARDQKEVIDWTHNLLTQNIWGMPPIEIIVENSFPQFLTKRNQLQNAEFKIRQNPGNYSIYFNRNNSHLPDGEQWSWFINDIDFYTPTITTTINVGSTSPLIFAGK